MFKYDDTTSTTWYKRILKFTAGIVVSGVLRALWSSFGDDFDGGGDGDDDDDGDEDDIWKLDPAVWSGRKTAESAMQKSIDRCF